MKLTGDMLIGAASVHGREAAFRATDPSSGETLEPAYGGAGPDEVERACALAWQAFGAYRENGLEQRAAFLETVARRIDDLADELVRRACQETALPRGRIESERARTTSQLRLFAAVVREGSWLDARIDPALPERKPLPRADLRLRQIAIGPVAVFGAGNFPLAFSVAGGDTASALAAGCPVVMKAHLAHPGTSEMVGRAVQAAVAECGLPEGVFSLLYGVGNWLGGALVADRRIKAVGFTGSRAGGLALTRVASERPEPIPVFAEMSSINPVLVMPAALAARGAAIGKGLIGSVTLGAGQFCTNPGVVLVQPGGGMDALLAGIAEATAASAPAPMLTAATCAAYKKGVERLTAHPKVEVLARGPESGGINEGAAAVFATDAACFLDDETLSAEVFGAATMLVRCRDAAEMRAVLEDMEGQLTATVHMEVADAEAVRALLPLLELKAGRIVVNGWPTGVEVGHAMVHGGPYPVTTDSRMTSVGTLAIRRFLRPVCYQDLPPLLLPEALLDGNPLGILRRVNGALGRE